jgi:hypothetical protein
MRTIQEIANAGTITENEIRTICRRLNAGTMKVNELEPIWNVGGVDVTPEQSAKGFNWLMNLWKTPTGKERKNNPYGWREQDILEHYDGCKFFDVYDCGNRYFQHWAPCYDCGFQYYVSGGQIQIIG